MDRRSFIAAVGASTAGSTAGCVDTVGSFIVGDDYEEKLITSLRGESDCREITVSAWTQSHFTEESPGILTVALTNHDRARTFLFGGFPDPWFSRLSHDTSGYHMGIVSTRQSVSPPAEQTDGCWMFDVHPPRPSVYAPKTVGPGGDGDQ